LGIQSGNSHGDCGTELTRFTPALLSSRFRQSVGTLALRGKGGILSLLEDSSPFLALFALRTRCRGRESVDCGSKLVLSCPREASIVAFEFAELVETNPAVRCWLFALACSIVDHIPNLLFVDTETVLLGAINERLDV